MILYYIIRLQHSLNTLHHYCNKWDLRVNIDKTKVIIFNKSGRLFKNVHFKYYGNSIECVNEFKYLGILFKPSGSFSAAVAKRPVKLFLVLEDIFSQNT